MWVFCKYGAVSITEVPQKFVIGYRDMQVRGRCRKQLEAILRHYAGSGHAALDCSSIVEMGHTDYPYRFYVTRPDAAMLVYRMAINVNYENFKKAVTALGEEAPPRYVNLLHRVWDTFWRWAEFHFGDEPAGALDTEPAAGGDDGLLDEDERALEERLWGDDPWLADRIQGGFYD